MSELEHCLLLLSGCPGDSRSCGLDIEHELSRIIEAVTSHIAKKTDHSSNASARLSSTHAQRCQLLVNRAKEAIATYPYSEVPVHWRRLYMDASLLQVVATAAVMTFSADAEDRKSSPTEDQTELLELVRVLDMANIVAAYFDQGRREAFFGLMRFLQSRLDRHFGTDTDSSCRLAPAKRRRIDPEGARFKDWKGFLLPGIKEIETYSVDDAPSFEELPFQTEPFVVKGPVASWPAIADSATSWKDEKYLLRIAGKGRLVPVEIGSSYTAEGWTQKIVAFDTFLREIDWQEDVEHRKPDKNESPSSSPMYLAQHDLFQQFPALLSDILVPDYVYADMQAPDHFPGYRPPAAEAGYTINAWMGPAGTYSPAHTDPFYNCYAQVVGRKHIWVSPPGCSAVLAGRACCDEDPDKGAAVAKSAVNAAAQQFMDNTATLDVFEASRQTTSDDSNLREFHRQVVPNARQIILEEGDLLFMPPKWWHSIKSLERSFSVSMWF